MRKPTIYAPEDHWRRSVRELWGKVHISTSAPTLADMEVGELWLLDPQNATATDYRLYAKVTLDAIVEFQGFDLISAEFDSAFGSGFAI